MSFEEQNRAGEQLRGSGWRHLVEPRTLSCYVGSRWMDAPASDVNDDTREVRIAYMTVAHGVRRFILAASLYRPAIGLFQH